MNTEQKQKFEKYAEDLDNQSETLFMVSVCKDGEVALSTKGFTDDFMELFVRLGDNEDIRDIIVGAAMNIITKYSDEQLLKCRTYLELVSYTEQLNDEPDLSNINPKGSC